MAGTYKMYSIINALAVGCLNASQTVHGKFLMKQGKFSPMNITADTALIFIIICSGITSFNLAQGHASINLRNAVIIFFSSCLGMICWLVGQNCSVKGLAGPTIAIIYSGCFFTTGFEIVFRGLVPTVTQLGATLLAFSGILIIIFGK
jgi:drug/metabolite transporter (DMT)-like permease